MDENKQKPRADYQPSVEAGLRRLESEKLSFLGSGNLVSKFDPENLEAYAHLGEDDEEDIGDSTSTYDRTLPEMPSDKLSRDITLNQVDDIDEISDPGEATTAHDPLLPVSDDKLPSAILEGDDDDDDDECTVTRMRDSLVNLGVVSAQRPADGADFWPSRPMPTLDFAALRNYESQSDIPKAELSPESLDAMDRAGEIQDLSSQQFTMVSSASVEVLDNVHQTMPNAGGRQSGSQPSAQAMDQMALVKQEMDRIERAQTHDFGREANEVYLETAETTDLGSVAERVREALEAQNLKAKSTARVIKQGAVKLQRPESAEPVSAMDKLKQQGIFEHLGAHAEVSHNILDIQELNSLLPQSEIRSCSDMPEADDGADIGEKTCEQEPEGVEEVRRMVMRVKAGVKSKPSSAEPDNMTVPLRQPDILPTPHAEEQDLDDRMTIPISLNDNPEFLEVLNANHNVPKPRHRSPVQEPLHSPTIMISESENRTRVVLIWGIVAIVLMMGAFALIYVTGLWEKLPFIHGSGPVIDASESSKVPPTQEEIAAAIVGTVLVVHQAADFHEWLEPWLEKRINHQISPEGRLTYVELAWEMYPQNPVHRQRLIEDYIAVGRFEDARMVIRNAPQDVQAQPAMKDLFYQSFSKDPRFIGPAMTLDETRCDMISPLGGGSTLTFKLLKDEKPVGAFKPLQTRRQSNYRSEIAAWRLCELLNCDFDIPWNRPIRIEYDFFHRLYNRAPAKKRNEYRQNLVDIIWTKEENSRFVYGTHKDWVSDFTRFPIELISMWRPWLSLDNFITEFEPLEEALSSLKRRSNTENLYPELLKQSPGLTTKQLATQVSEVLVFDYLVGNWDRFSGVPDWWGVNCQFTNGRITSIDNGAAFPTYSNDKVYTRFMNVERFNPQFIQALRNLDKAKTFELLFPGASEYETKGFEQFWKQRESVLKRVDELILKHGAEKVLSL